MKSVYMYIYITHTTSQSLCDLHSLRLGSCVNHMETLYIPMNIISHVINIVVCNPQVDPPRSRYIRLGHSEARLAELATVEVLRCTTLVWTSHTRNFWKAVSLEMYYAYSTSSNINFAS